MPVEDKTIAFELWIAFRFSYGLGIAKVTVVDDKPHVEFVPLLEAKISCQHHATWSNTLTSLLFLDFAELTTHLMFDFDGGTHITPKLYLNIATAIGQYFIDLVTKHNNGTALSPEIVAMLEKPLYLSQD